MIYTLLQYKEHVIERRRVREVKNRINLSIQCPFSVCNQEAEMPYVDEFYQWCFKEGVIADTRPPYVSQVPYHSFQMPLSAVRRREVRGLRGKAGLGGPGGI